MPSAPQRPDNVRVVEYLPVPRSIARGIEVADAALTLRRNEESALCNDLIKRAAARAHARRARSASHGPPHPHPPDRVPTRPSSGVIRSV